MTHYCPPPRADSSAGRCPTSDHSCPLPGGNSRTQQCPLSSQSWDILLNWDSHIQDSCKAWSVACKTWAGEVGRSPPLSAAEVTNGDWDPESPILSPTFKQHINNFKNQPKLENVYVPSLPLAIQTCIWSTWIINLQTNSRKHISIKQSKIGLAFVAPPPKKNTHKTPKPTKL